MRGEDWGILVAIGILGVLLYAGACVLAMR